MVGVFVAACFRHGTGHDFKPLPRSGDLFTGTPSSVVQTKEVSRSRCGPARVRRDLFALPSNGTGLRSARRTALRVHSPVGVFHLPSVCSDMCGPYLKVIREKCSEILHILDRFHIVAK